MLKRSYLIWPGTVNVGPIIAGVMFLVLGVMVHMIGIIQISGQQKSFSEMQILETKYLADSVLAVVGHLEYCDSTDACTVSSGA